jgi:HEPN superfamily RiboL-PSP-like protein
MASARFRELERRLKKLRAHFLPATFSPTGDYTDRQLDHARGYRLLAHAEIEAFLEDRCRDVANSTLRRYRTDRRPKAVLLNMLSFHLVQGQLGKDKLKAIYAAKTNHCDESLTDATSAYNNVLAKNQGIREDNMLKMILPLGLDPGQVDATWLNTLDAFGGTRGEVAHTSIRTQQQIDPQDELKTVESLLKGLETLDGLIDTLR